MDLAAGHFAQDRGCHRLYFSGKPVNEMVRRLIALREQEDCGGSF
jgi:hypothetical protein